MINLTSFELTRTAPGEISTKHLLDFFESAPNLCKIELYSATPTSGTQHGRLVSPACLKRVYAASGGPPSLLLGHLLIPVGACLTTEVEFPSPPIKDQPPRFLDNLRNLPNFTSIRLSSDEYCPHIQFNGPNGEVRMNPRTPHADTTDVFLEPLVHFDTSKAERLDILSGNLSSSDHFYRALLPTNNLRTLMLYRCTSPQIFIDGLHPGASSSKIMVFPNWKNWPSTSISTGRNSISRVR